MKQAQASLLMTVAEALVVFALALVVLSAFISPTPHVDEFYHVLAARSLVENGTLTINDGGGDYTRARAYTYAVAACYQLFGESFESARLPSVIAAALLVVAVFGWLHRVASRRAAWIGAFLLGMAPSVIGFSSMVRFYMPHTLFVWLTAVCVYALVVGGQSRSRRAALVLFGSCCALIAAHLQTTTAIAALVVSVWMGTEFVGWWTRAERAKRRRAAVWGVLICTVGIPAVWMGIEFSGALDHMIDKFQTPRLWSMSHRNEVVYYHRFFNENYPLLWAGFPFAALAALASRRRPAWFCLVVFCLAFAIHSLMPFKSTRYLSYAWPCFFAVWAIALDGLLVWLHGQAKAVIGQVFGEWSASSKAVGYGIGCFLIGGLAFAAMVSPSYKLSRKMLTGETLGPLAREDWSAVVETLKPIADETGFVVSSTPPKAVYYLDRIDVTLSVSQAAGREEFAIHRLTGRPVITTAESVQRLMEEHANGLIVVESAHFGARWYVPRETALYIESHTQPIELPPESGVRAFRWTTHAEPVSGSTVQ